ncbi:PLP-dependent aspartate aminotransferase family protein [Roseivirga sp. BDSF3-8]|uniref:trans-sulfuration enzyme family protein n=1 Tax=Roseivirga sp. BDSF3-8 TaxID=3241598 RepID=UPI00353192F7
MDYDNLSYILNHTGEEQRVQGAAVPPVFQTSNFLFDTIDAMAECLSHEDEMPFYSRGVNPTVDVLRKKMAALEGTEDCLAFGSGSAAIAAGIMANVQQGDHVVCVQKPYSWTAKLLDNLLSRFGVSTTYVDGRETANIRAAIRPETKMLFLESPNSWTFELQDIEAAVAVAKEKGLLTLMDNSYCTPLNMKPAQLGVDIIMHSATKYIGGHSDAVAGILCASKAMCKKIFAGEFMTLGGILSPMNAWLLVRGLRTLHLRMERVSHTAAEVVRFLEAHDKVAEVYYPFLPSHPQHELAMRQMKRGGGQFTITLATEDEEKVKAFCESLTYFGMGCSWGGHESLIFPALTLHRSQNYKSTLPANMIRFYTGLEEADELIADLRQALDAI